MYTYKLTCFEFTTENSIVKNISDETVFSNNCSLGQAFTMIDNFCHDNNASYSITDISIIKHSLSVNCYITENLSVKFFIKKKL